MEHVHARVAENPRVTVRGIAPIEIVGLNALKFGLKKPRAVAVTVGNGA